MRNLFHFCFLILVFFGSVTASAGTQVLGVEIGVTTVEQLKQSLSKKAKIEDRGENKYTGGAMIKTDGKSYEIDGLTEVLYIFDDQKKLAGLVMSMNKARFDAVFQFLNGKYKVTSQERPFVGNQSAVFRPTDATIEIDAPHMSFEMEVRYIRNDLMQKYNSQSASEAAAKKKNEGSKF
jgi:hypothetical protein